jgi:hypothetical protein
MDEPRLPQDVNRAFDAYIAPGEAGSSFRFELEILAVSDDGDFATFDAAVRVVSWRYRLSHAENFFAALAGFRLAH